MFQGSFEESPWLNFFQKGAVQRQFSELAIDRKKAENGSKEKTTKAAGLMG